ncbi:MAG: peptidoglycan DD-metalloendopeptidase family protein [Anaerolineales bacterium]|uniref:LysM peptidoglycan-binding domain-containing M23 family metallopeptidase n=1 Tax=Candidatus Villigracilis vicinus TaxID=3140679 RepID=UPI0031365D0A|nr:peptidoglycan DD-metalloendopeptidase family protein [Anaerolineales bacterium]MBK9778758.1 peptidoglycan DD-metalloendopeptidase family protein [Anaerolineales bacterium]
MRKLVLTVLLSVTLLIPFKPALAQDTGPVYVVQPGDSLYSIAARFSISLDDLLAANGIADPNSLAAGQQLIIPGLDGVSGILDTKFINFGDSYRGLMRQTQVPDALFRKLNHVVSPSEFYVGTNMIVPLQDQTQYSKRVSPATGESMLELAVKNNTDVWSLNSINQLDGSWAALPGDTLYAPGESSENNASGLPSAFISAEIRDLPIKQGGTGVITVTAQPGVKLGGLLVDHQLQFFPSQGGTLVALQGVHALLEPGVYPLRLDATLPDGSTQSYEQLILIVSGNYPEDPLLYVDPATIDPASTEPESQQLISLTTPATPTKYWVGDFISPAIAYAESTYFTSRYGNRRTYIGQGTELSVQGFHTGLDFGGGDGLPITAPASGIVIFAGPLTVRGNATVIDHGWGVYSGFWHQSAMQVEVGQSVNLGDVIGLVGGTGRVTGAHLHWELWVNGVQVDPLDWLNQPYP